METRPEQLEDGDYVELLDIGEQDAFATDKQRYCSRIYRAYDVNDVKTYWWTDSPEYQSCRLRPLVKRVDDIELDEIPFAEAKLRKLDVLEAYARLVQMGLNNPEQS